MNTDQHFGQQLRRRRKILDLTQEQLAEQASCSVDLVRKIERGQRRPSRELAAQLAGALQLPAEALADFVAAARSPLGTPPPPAAMPRPTPPPLQVGPLIGRNTELAALDQMLADPARRLVTLIGPGGSGKTRLAIEAARRAKPANEIAFATLAGLSEPGRLPLTLAEALGMSLAGQRLPEVQLSEHLRERQLLLVLDSLEQLGEGVILLAELLGVAPGLRVLATSRERLGLQGEWLVEVGGLSLGAGAGALALLLHHIERVRGSAALSPTERAAAAQICALVEGSPLAIELAAGWSRSLSCVEIAAEIASNLDFLSTTALDLPPRQRSIRATFDYAWALLTAPQRRLLARLALFPGCDRPAAEAIADATSATLAQLVDRSLLRRGNDGRYTLSALLRQFAAEQLAHQPDREALRARHAQHFAARLGAAIDALRGPAQHLALAALLPEIENLRMAWGWIIGAGDSQLALLALKPLWHLHEIRGWQREGLVLFAAAASAWGQPDLVAAELLAAQGWFALRTGSHTEARLLLERSLVLARALDVPQSIATALDYLGLLELMLGHNAEARLLLYQSLNLHRTAGNRWGEAFALGYLGLIAARLADPIATELLEQAIALMRALGDPRGLASCLLYLGSALARRGDLAAESYLRESLALAGQVGDRWTLAAAMGYLGAVAQARGEADTAAYLFSEAIALMQALGDPWGEAQIRALLTNG